MDAETKQLLIQTLIQWGPGMIIAVLVLGGLYRLANTVGSKIVASSEKQAVAIEGLTKSIEGFVARDNSEHREILILTKMTLEKVEHLEDQWQWTQRRNDTKESAAPC